MKHVLNKLTAALLCIAMLLSMTGAVADAEELSYGVCTGNQINVRREAGTSAKVWFQVDEGHVGLILGTQKVDGELWYKIDTSHPEHGGYPYTGYILEDYFRPMTVAEQAAYLAENGIVVTPDAIQEGNVSFSGVEVTGAVGKTTAKVNFRNLPSTSLGQVISTIPKYTEVEVTAIPKANDKDGWYRIRYQKQTGYVSAEYLTLVKEGTPTNGTQVTGVMGEVTANGVSFLAGAGVNETLYAKLNEGTQVEILTIPDKISVNDWYQVRYDGKVGYIQSNFIRVTEGDADGGIAVAVGVIVNTNGVNFRVGPGTQYTSMRQLKSGVQVEILSIPAKVDTAHWFRVRYDGEVGYIQSPYIQVLGNNETTKPDVDEAGKIVSLGEVTAADGVNFRAGAGVNYSKLGHLPQGTIVQLMSIPEVIDHDHWYSAYYQGTHGYIYGYIQAPYLRVIAVNEDDLPEVEKYGYAKLIKEHTSLRKTPGGETAVRWLGQGSLLRVTGQPVTKGSYTWYPVYHTSDTAIYYVRDDAVTIVQVENGEIIVPDTNPDTESKFGFVITTKPNVNMRIQPGEGTLIQIPLDTVLTCVGKPVSPKESGTDYTWYAVRYGGMAGYVRGDCVRVCNADGGDVNTPPETDPAQNPDAGVTIRGYIKLTKDNVNLRKTPQGNSQGQLPKDLILPITGEIVPEGVYGKYTWYPVRTADGRNGYIRGDCAKVCDENGNDTDEKPGEPPEVKPDLVGAKGKMLKNTNFRKGMSTGSAVITVIPTGTVVDVLQIPEDTKNGWYKIRYNEKEGYVVGYLIEMVEAGEEGEGGEDEEEPNPTTYGYVQITGNRVHVRKTPEGTSQTQVDTGSVWPIIGASIKKGEVEWFNVRVGDVTGYVHGGYAYKLSPTQEESYLNGNGVPEEKPAPELVPSNYLITTSDKLNIRESYSQDSTAVYQVGKNTVMKYFDTKKVGTVTWYSVLYNDLELWVHGDYIKVMTEAEYQDWAAKNPDKVPDTNKNMGFVKTTQGNVYIRNAAYGSIYIDQMKSKGTVMRYYEEGIAAGGSTWYRVLTPKGAFGYVRSDLVEKCAEDGGELPIPVPDLGDISNAPQSQQETSYSRLKLGSSGTKVLNLVNELINQGYYKGKATSNYTTEVQAAVKAFQTVKGLDVDGIAGSGTQHALFGTRPIGAGDTDNLEFTIYPVEKIDWFTGGIQDMLPRGANFKIYDVKTGIVWWAHRWAGGKHADIETLTLADSQRLCKIYGVDSLAEIVKENMWERRPCLVTIGTRTFACSLDGMQHNPDGDTISNNGMDGQICLHFTNSTGHSPGASVSDSHSKAIEYAYNNCPAGQKK